MLIRMITGKSSIEKALQTWYSKKMKLETGITANSKCSRSGHRILEKIRVAGFKNAMLDQEGSRNLKRFISAAFDVGLKVPFVHLDSSDASTMWHRGEAKEKFIDYISNSIEICGQNQINTVVLHPTHKKVGCEPNEIGLDSINKILQTAQSNNVKIALENSDMAHLAHIEYLLKMVKSPNLGFCFDSGHWNLYMPDVDLLGKYGNRLMAIHLHDNLGMNTSEAQWDEKCNLLPFSNEPSESEWDQDLHLLPFDGTADFRKVASGIADSCYKGPVMLEPRRNFKDGKRYAGVSPEAFLADAYNRAEYFAQMVDCLRSY